jgi:hypothetical protein
VLLHIFTCPSHNGHGHPTVSPFLPHSNVLGRGGGATVNVDGLWVVLTTLVHQHIASNCRMIDNGKVTWMGKDWSWPSLSSIPDCA